MVELAEGDLHETIWHLACQYVVEGADQPRFGVMHAKKNTVNQLRRERERPMKTGQDVQEPGLYVSECCNVEVELIQGASFPRCSRCSSLTTWEKGENLEKAA